MERYPVSEKTRRIEVRALLLNFVMLLVGMWGWLYPRPYLLALGLLAALPWLALALALRRPGAYTVEDPDQGYLRGDLTVLLFMPGFVLVLRAMQDTNLLEPAALLIPALIGHLAWLSLLVWKLPSLRRPGKFVLYAVFLAPYPASLIALANCVLDGAGTSHQVTVAGKRVTSGKGATRYIALAPGGPLREAVEVRVSGDLFLALRRGGPVCMHLHGGALGLAWVSVSERC